MKTKLIIFAAVAALMIAGCSKERETPEPTPEEAQYDIYVAGTYWKGETFGSCYWKNGERHELAYPGNNKIYTRGIAVADGSLYIVGKDNGLVTGYWKDGDWNPNDIPLGIEYASCSSIAVSAGSVYTAGDLTTTDGNNYIYTPGYWQDGVWKGLPMPGDATTGYATSIATGGGSVYATGYVQIGEYTGYWKDMIWQELERPKEAATAVCRLITYADGSVYGAGNYTVGSARKECYWVNGVLHDLPAPEGMDNIYVESIAVCDGSIYMAGFYLSDAGDLKAFYWKNGVFTALETPAKLATTNIRIAAVEGVAYVSGDYYENDVSHACYWKDGVRTDLPVPEGMNAMTAGIAVVKRQ